MARLSDARQLTDRVMLAKDRTVRTALLRAERARKIKSFGLVFPLLAFICVTFLFPMAEMLFQSVDNPLVHQNWPRTTSSLDEWDGEQVPPEPVFAAVYEDMVESDRAGMLGQIGTRLNYDLSGARTLINKTRPELENLQPPFRESLVEVDPRWGDIEIWRVIERASQRFTEANYLAALDMGYAPDGSLEPLPESQRIYMTLFVRTLLVSLCIVVICGLFAYPVAYLLATLPANKRNALMILVILPFWTALLVRITAWIVLLQENGVVNETLVWLGIVGDAARPSLIYNMTGTIIVMVHILLPFMILPIYSVMKTIPAAHLRAAKSLGANPVVAFWRVYAPQTIPGVGAGSIMVFILAVGYYVTPALVGGRTGQLSSNYIAYHMQTSLNWGLAAALAAILLSVVLVMYFWFNRVIGISKMRIG